MYLFIIFGSAGSLFCGGCSPPAELRLLTEVASLVAEQRLQGTGSVVVMRSLSCSEACGVFPNQGSNLCLLHWQADSLPLSPQDSPAPAFLNTLPHWKNVFKKFAHLIGQKWLLVSLVSKTLKNVCYFIFPFYYCSKCGQCRTINPHIFTLPIKCHMP